MRWIKRHPRIAAAIALFLVLGAILSATSSGSNKSAGAHPSGANAPHTSARTDTKANGKPHLSATEISARSYVKALGFDARKVQASIRTVLLAVGEFQQSKTEANVGQLARVALAAHNGLNSIRGDFAADAPNATGRLQNAEVEVWQAANSLKNSMGSLVTLAGNPNAATEAQFSNQYPQARAEWNAGIRKIWQMAHLGNAPTI